MFEVHALRKMLVLRSSAPHGVSLAPLAEERQIEGAPALAVLQWLAQGVRVEFLLPQGKRSICALGALDSKVVEKAFLCTWPLQACELF